MARLAGGSFAALIRGFDAGGGVKSGAARVVLAKLAGGSFAALVRGFDARCGVLRGWGRRWRWSLVLVWRLCGEVSCSP